ncbi:MAG: pyridoxamine kinase [Clostridia bacterium]|nr:pyridoxamine kinase [Clostridia bacterium]
MRRIVTIQDISCLGKCSLTVALPVISVYGVEACVLPTATLSTHTMFSGFTFTDLTDDMQPIKAHWLKENFKFDAIYTGYLGSERQLSIVKEYFDDFASSNCLKIIDPVMADNGKLYTGFTVEFAHNMAKLCANADIILPNLTEACYMLDEEYIPCGYSRDYIKSILRRLTGLGAKIAVLTGVSYQPDKIGVMGYYSVKDEYFEYYNSRIPAQYHGTGDIFASAFVGGMMRGYDILKALEIAADYTALCIDITQKSPDSVTYGVEFEKAIPYLVHRLEQEDKNI